jgi:hypothetical protein
MRMASVEAETATIYKSEVAAFRCWCAQQNLEPLEGSTLDICAHTDSCMERYFVELYKQGYGVARPRFTLYGWLLLHTSHDGNRGKPFPGCSRLLRSFSKGRPGSHKDPWPEFAVMALVHQLALMGRGLIAFAV